MTKMPFSKRLRAGLRAMLESRGRRIIAWPQRGVDAIHDMCEHGDREFETVFDIGANNGDTAALFLSGFPAARLWLFEPGRQMHAALQSRFSGNPRVTVEHAALGASSGTVKLLHTASDTMSFIGEAARSPLGEVTCSETATMVSLDAYCSGAGIPNIDFLNIDTEGYDLEVLIGAEDLLRNSAVSFVECECGMNPENALHCRFEDVNALLLDHGYRLFGFYEQVPEWISQQPHLRRANAVYISPGLIGRGRGRANVG